MPNPPLHESENRGSPSVFRAHFTGIHNTIRSNELLRANDPKRLLYTDLSCIAPNFNPMPWCSLSTPPALCSLNANIPNTVVECYCFLRIIRHLSNMKRSYIIQPQWYQWEKWAIKTAFGKLVSTASFIA